MSLDKRINWIARDCDGEIWGYENKPEKRIKRWTSRECYWGVNDGFFERLTKDNVSIIEWEQLSYIEVSNDKPIRYLRKTNEKKYSELKEENLKLKNEIKELKKPKQSFGYDRGYFYNLLTENSKELNELKNENICLSDNNETLSIAHSLLTVELDEKKELIDKLKYKINSCYSSKPNQYVEPIRELLVVEYYTSDGKKKVKIDSNLIPSFIKSLHECDIIISSISNDSYVLEGGNL